MKEKTGTSPQGKNYLTAMRYSAVLLLLAGGLFAAFCWALSIGSVSLPLKDILRVVVEQFTSGKGIEDVGQGAVHDIVWLLRFPRLLLAAAAGSGGAGSGFLAGSASLAWAPPAGFAAAAWTATGGCAPAVGAA